MKDSINNIVSDTLNIVGQVNTTESMMESTNWWMWVAVAELVIIIVLLNKLLDKKKKQKDNDLERFKAEAKNGEVDWGNLQKSFYYSKELYDLLIRKCHPDRFPADADKNRIADELSKEIGKNKTNLKRLEELKLEAQNKLNIKF